MLKNSYRSLLWEEWSVPIVAGVILVTFLAIVVGVNTGVLPAPPPAPTPTPYPHGYQHEVCTVTGYIPVGKIWVPITECHTVTEP